GGDLTLFMAVPTIYGKLITAWEAAAPERRRAWSAGCAPPRMRLMVSGSAALPVQRLERWRGITGHVLLERYGMTEIGMALANPLHGERRPGFVGTPLPGVEVRLVDEAGRPVPAGTPGEIEVRGETVFLEYWRRPDATGAAFRDGWFRTGDVAVSEHGAYRMLGRSSVDIIKTGGYKVSALEVEEVLRTHPAIAECAVVGVEDPEWGERICAAVEPRGDANLTLATLQAWAKERLAPYKIPRRRRARLACRARSHHERGDQPSDHHVLGGGPSPLPRGAAGVRSRSVHRRERALQGRGGCRPGLCVRLPERREHRQLARRLQDQPGARGTARCRRVRRRAAPDPDGPKRVRQRPGGSTGAGAATGAAIPQEPASLARSC